MKHYFTKTELALWSSSTAGILIAFFLFDRTNLLSIAVTAAFYFILDHFHTANMLPSTLSVTTSFIAVYLTFRRSPYFALVYAANDLVLILLWTLAAKENVTYISVIICFVMFLINDLYGFISWRAMEKRQTQTA